MRIYYDPLIGFHLDLDAITAITDIREGVLSKYFAIHLKLHDKPWIVDVENRVKALIDREGEYETVESGEPFRVAHEQIDLTLEACRQRLIQEWSEPPREYYIHLKTGNVYEVIDRAINATNGPSRGEQMVIYRNSLGIVFVRTASEFLEKFKKRP